MKHSYSGYTWLHGATCIFSVVEHILKLGYSGYNRLQGILHAYFCCCDYCEACYIALTTG